MPKGWNQDEVEAAIAEYFVMLGKELRGETFNKAEHNRHLQKHLGRSHGAIEQKHMNISAVLIELGYPYIDGYKPLGNYQISLYKTIEARLRGELQLEKAVSDAVESAEPNILIPTDILSVVVKPPEREKSKGYLAAREGALKRPTHRNYLAMEARNQSRGQAGEEFIMKFEHERLWRAGQRKLAEKIDHVSKSQGDGLGYDIHSFEENGRDRLIEVKTTRFGKMTPFFASPNEIEVSTVQEPEFQLYRLFNFHAGPKLYVLKGALGDTCELTPVNYSAFPK